MHPIRMRKGASNLGFIIPFFLMGCADPHFLPRCRPLFPGLDETTVPVSDRAALGQAKADFERARHDKPPLFARCVETRRGTQTKVFAGHGYLLTLVHEEYGYSGRRDGPRIVLNSCLTGAAPFTYEEVDEVDH